jgi:putative transposase
MLRVHKIALNPNNRQAGLMAKSAGVARFAYNWALAEWKRQYEAGGKPSEVSLRKHFNALKKSDFPWCYEVTKNAPQQAIKNVGKAFERFFKKQGKYPRFKKKGVHDSFRADDGTGKMKPQAVQIDGNRVKLPVIGWVRMREELRFSGQVRSAVVSKTAARWFVALSVETEDQPETCENQGVVGVDLGIKTMAVCSNGMKFEAPNALRKRLKKLAKLQRIAARRKKGSKNRHKAVAKVARLHAKIANIRSDALHKATTAICKSGSLIVLEDLNVKGMMKNGKLSRAISDVGLYEFRRQCEYKTELFGSEIMFAPRFEPSSKRCSCCGIVRKTLLLSEREWTCDNCGAHHDRDENAAQNLENYGTARSAGIYACGEISADVLGNHYVKLNSVKQEIFTGATQC